MQIQRAGQLFDTFSTTSPGSSYEISVKDLVETIARLTGFEGKIVWDTGQPNGQLRRKLDVSKAELWFGFCSRVSFEDGLRETIEWYKVATQGVQLPVTRSQIG